MDKDDVWGDNVGTEEQESHHKEAVQLTKNMNAATANLNLLSLEGDQHDNDEEEFDSTIKSENTINFYSDDKEGENFLEDDHYIWQDDLTLADDFYTASEVSSGIFDATHSNKFEEPDDFEKLLMENRQTFSWEHDHSAWLTQGWSRGCWSCGTSNWLWQNPMKLLEFMVLDAGEDQENQIIYRINHWGAGTNQSDQFPQQRLQLGWGNGSIINGQ